MGDFYEFLFINIGDFFRLFDHKMIQVEAYPNWNLLPVNNSCALVQKDSPNRPVSEYFHEEGKDVSL
jgi:hypothetical protein